MDKIIENAKEKIAELTQSATSLFTKDVVGAIKDYSLDKLNETWTQIENSAEIFSQTGYSILTIDIVLGIPPTLVLSLEQIENIGDEQEEKLLEEHKDKTFIYPILVALFKANAIQKSINSVKYKFSGLTIGVGINPSIDMKFRKVE